MLDSTRRRVLRTAGVVAGLAAIPTASAQQLPPENESETEPQNGSAEYTPNESDDQPERTQAYQSSDGWLHIPPGGLDATLSTDSGLSGLGLSVSIDAEQPDPNHDQGSAGSIWDDGTTQSNQSQDQEQDQESGGDIFQWGSESESESESANQSKNESER